MLQLPERRCGVTPLFFSGATAARPEGQEKGGNLGSLHRFLAA